MSVLHVIEQGSLRTGGDNYQGTADSQRYFEVITDDGTQDESVVLTAVDPTTSVAIPALLDAHPTRFGMYCAARSVRWSDDFGRQSLATISYSYIQPFVPWEMPAVYNGGQQAETRPLDKDIGTGYAVLNSAHQPFDPGLSVERYSSTLEVQVNYLVGSMPNPASYVGCVNSTTFKGAAMDYCKCIGMPYQENINFIWDGVIYPYVSMTMQFAFKNPSFESWQPLVADSGYCKLNTANTPATLVEITIGGKTLSSPAFLNGSGQPLASNANPVYLGFQGYPRVDFNALGI